MNGRVHEKSEPAVHKKKGALHVLAAPRPGLVRGLPAPGSVLRGGELLGELEVLGQISTLVVPHGASGAVVESAGGGRAKVPAGHGTVLVVLDPALGASVAADAAGAAEAEGAAGLVFRTPLGGRYYARPSPGAEPFVKVGDTIETGATIALVEVMKTFHRVRYGGEGLPATARVKRVLPKEGDDLGRNDAILELEPG